MKFHEQVAKSIYDYNLDRVVKNNLDGVSGGFSFYCLATKKQATYVCKKSGTFIGKDGLLIHFRPFSGWLKDGNCAISFFYYPPQNSACQPASNLVE